MEKPHALPHTTGTVLHGARGYDLFTRILLSGRDRAIREQLLELSAPARGEEALDVGCGTGTLAIALEKRAGASRVHGIDASSEMIRFAKEKAAKSGAEVDLQIALIEAIPFPNAAFDLVTSSLMLHHLPDDLQEKGFAEIRRVLKPGGRFAIVDFAANSHSPIGHLLSIFGHGHGASAANTLLPRLKNSGFGDVAVVPTRHKNFLFIRAS